jgi:biuret amidohydrolase
VSTTTPAGPVAATTVDSTPYPWPYHGRLDPARSVLVACLDRWWRTPGDGSDEADARLGELAAALASTGVTVVAVTATPVRRWGAHGPGGRVPTAGSPGGLPVEADVIVEAGGTSAFFESPLDGLLRRSGRTDVIIAGWGLEGPVHSTMRSANDRGYECLLASDASVASDPDLREPACSMIRLSGGIFGAYTDTETICAAFSSSEKRRNS